MKKLYRQFAFQLKYILFIYGELNFYIKEIINFYRIYLKLIVDYIVFFIFLYQYKYIRYLYIFRLEKTGIHHKCKK